MGYTLFPIMGMSSLPYDVEVLEEIEHELVKKKLSDKDLQRIRAIAPLIRMWPQALC